MSQRINFPYLFVLGHSHCGSTLLGRMMNRHGDVICPGELLWLDDALEKQIPCSCGQAIESCPFWVRRLPLVPKSVLGNYKRTEMDFFESVRVVEGRSVLLDLSKSRIWRHKRLWKADGVGYLFLMRDPRGVLASRVRGGGDFEVEVKKHRKWEKRFEKFHERMARSGRSLLVFYEDLVTAPAGVLKSVCSFAGLEYSPIMLDPEAGEHHFIHSSVSAYLKGGSAVRKDERWKTELGAEQVGMIHDVLGGLTLYRERYGLGVS